MVDEIEVIAGTDGPERRLRAKGISKKVRCFTIKDDSEGCYSRNLKRKLEEFGLSVYSGNPETQDSSGAHVQITVSDKPLIDEELSEIKEFWPEHHVWTDVDKDDSSPNQNNDVK